MADLIYLNDKETMVYILSDQVVTLDEFTDFYTSFFVYRVLPLYKNLTNDLVPIRDIYINTGKTDNAGGKLYIIWYEGEPFNYDDLVVLASSVTYNVFESLL